MRWQAHYGCGLRGPSRVGNCLTLGVGNYLTPPLGNYLTLLHLRLGNYLIVDNGHPRGHREHTSDTLSTLYYRL